MEFFTNSLNHFMSLPLLELSAVFLAFAYVILAAKMSIWCWPAALISTAIYTYIFYDVYLFMDSALSAYYLIMAVYGWWCWRKSSTGVEGKNELAITSWPFSFHLKVIPILALVSLLVGWLMANNTEASFPYIDSATTVYAVFATYMVAQKILENWLYWIVIDFVSIFIYIEKDLQPTAALFTFYVIFAIYGLVLWVKEYSKESNAANNIGEAV